MTGDSLTTRLACHRMKPYKNESSENVGVQPVGHGFENVTPHPGLVEITPTLLEHDPLDLILGGKYQELVRHI